MQSNFSHTLDGMRRISGNSSSDMQNARTAADELEAFAAARFKTISDFSELREVVTCSDEERIRSALAAIRHIHSALKELAEFHHSGLLASSFDVPFHNVDGLLKKAEKQTAALLEHLKR